MGRIKFRCTREGLEHLLGLPEGYRLEGFEYNLARDQWEVYLSNPKLHTIEGAECPECEVAKPYGYNELMGLP